MSRPSPVGGPATAETWVSLEAANPAGSYKTRMAPTMLEETETRGELHPAGQWSSALEAQQAPVGTSYAASGAIRCGSSPPMPLLARNPTRCGRLALASVHPQRRRHPP